MANFAAAHGERISHFHLNDTRRARDEHLPFGSGTIDFAAIFDALGDWTGTLSLEVFTLDFEYVATSKERLDALL
ncbi:sugar phosphate isomerase/epimerase family protein [Halomarina litorea]|uniref:sugar phosphate isomerase/epimerase family protein n=1 Tax=Halomarina litorea TaxID=2961595 RepID=UPI0020C1DD29|nr:TIM barrel protein [Halomarina sp. BCD28]